MKPSERIRQIAEESRCERMSDFMINKAHFIEKYLDEQAEAKEKERHGICLPEPKCEVCGMMGRPPWWHYCTGFDSSEGERTCQVVETMLTSYPPQPGPKCGNPLPCSEHPVEKAQCQE